MGEKIKIYEKEGWKIRFCLSVCGYQAGLEIHLHSCADKVVRCFPHILGQFSILKQINDPFSLHHWLMLGRNAEILDDAFNSLKLEMRLFPASLCLLLLICKH